MLSSLVFQHSLRQSAACIEGLQYSPHSHLFFTVDSNALRAWTPTKQLRAFHLEKDFHFLKLDYIEEHDVFLFIYHKPSSNCVYAELWNPELNPLHKVKFEQKFNSKVAFFFSPSKSILILTDENLNLFVYKIIIEKQMKQYPLTWFPKGISLNDVNERKEYQYRLQLNVVQIISASDVNIASIQDLFVINDHLFFVASNKSMFVFSREINIDFSEAPEKYETQSPQILNSKFELLAFHESLFSNLGATVTTLVAFPSISTEYYMFVGYDNGSIGIYFLGHLNLENTFMNLKNLPFLLLVYQAHYPELNLPFKPLCLQLSPWATGFGSTYLLEYFSIGSDFKVVHWGLRRTYKYDVEHSVDIDTLGVHKFPFGSVESSRYQHLRKENPLSLITPCICPFTIKSLAPVHKFSRHCSSRGLIVSVCGMLAIFLVQQPSRLFTTFQCPYPFISASTGKVSIPRISIAKDTRDDPECGVLGDEVSESDTTSEHLLFCLSEGNILAYSITTGELVFQMAVPVHVPSAPVLHSLHFMDGKLSSSKECSPCHLHFSANTSHLMIGYTDGTCCLCEFELSGLSSQSTIGQITQTIYLPENVHKSPITFMKTIEISSQIECKDSWLLVGDSVGFISIWMIPHQRDQRFRDNIKLHIFMQGHIASVSAVDIVSLSHSISTGGSNICVPGNYLVLSASYAGDLKAWSWSEFAGELTCVGGIHDTGGRISAVHVLKLEVLDENKELYMLCMTGHSSGLIQTWTFSSNLKHLMKEPISSIVVHSGRVLSLHPTNIYTSCVSKNCILSTSADGSTAFLEITHEGKISVLQRYFSTGMTHATFVRDGNMEIEIFQIYDDRITSFLAASNCSLIPSHYRNENKIKGVNGSLSQDSKHDEVQDSSDPPTSTRKTSSASQFNLVLDIDDGLEPYKSIEPTQITPLSNRSLSTDVSLGQVNSLKIGHLSLKHLKHLTNREIWKADNQEFDALHDEINDEEVALPFFSEPQERSNLDNLATWNITLEVRVELQNAKKDKALLDYFRQNCITTKFPSEVITARDAAEILDRWVAEVIKNNTIGDTITKKQVLDIFAVLNVSENDLLDFLKVAKLGAVLVTIHKNMVKSEPFQEQGISRSENRLKKKFSQMRTTNTLISYNSMGEKVIQKRNLQISATAGIPNGYASVLRKIWSRTSTRVPYHLNGVDMIGYNQCTIMKNIPAHIKKLLNKKIKSPQSWSSRLEHFFDIKRAVRISRTLFDMRQNYQQEFIQNNSKVPSMSEIMITYFERNFGGDIQIAHLKVVHFLESLCQYSDFSLLNTLRYFIFSEEESNSRIQRYVWLYVESRRWLFLHCDIMTGGSVTATQGQQFKVGSLLEPSLTSCGTTLPFYLNWLLIQKSDTLLCLNEFLAIRGLYGPSIRENIQSVINHALVSSTHEDVELSTPSACYVDMEQFLEALIFETKKQDQLIMEVKEQIFGSIAIPHNTRNSSQMMTDESLLSTSLTRSNAVCMSLLNTLHEIQEMLQMFMGTDTERTGFTSSDTFKTVLLNCLNGTDLLEDQDGRDYCEESLQMKLFQECLTRYSSGDGSDAIGYIDFVALTMSWIYQQSEEVSRLHSGWILTAISSLRRGIDREQGKALLLFLASAQAFPSSADPYWMARNRRFESKMESGCSTSLPSLASINQNETSSLFQPQSKVISYLGNWNLASSIASDNPGVLTVQKVTSALPRKSLSEIALGVDGKEWKLLAKSTADGSCRNITIPTTNRELRTVHGEVCHHHLKFTTPHISSFELTSQIENMPLDIIFQPKSELIDGIRYDKGYLSGERLGRNLKSDHSSQHKSVSLHIPLKSKSATNILAPKMSDIPFSLDPNLDTSSTTNMQNNNCPHSEFASSSISLETGHISNAYGLLRKSANVYSPDAEEQSLENSLRDYETMRKMEEELLDDIDDAHLQMNIKLHEKYLAEKENQRRMKMKEQESMHFKELADEERMKRKQQALILEAKARALEEADRIAKEEETKKKQADIRAARAAQEAVKREKELLEAEIHRELLELQSMRKEERYSISVEKAIAERIAREEQMKLEQLAKEEAEREAARLKALIEEERKIKAEQEALRQAELAAKKIERENELQEQSHMSQEDYDVGLDNSDSEPVVEATPDESEVVEPPKPPKVELSGARLKLYNIIKRLIATKSGHKNHPRKNDSDQFFMPFNFGQDMRFDPFATDPNWTGPISLEDEDETSMPQTGYDDISKYLREKKIFLEKKTKNQLYHLNNPNIPSQDWTPMFRVDPIDWPEYFQDQLHQLKQHLDTSTNPPELHSDINYQNDKALSVRNLENVTTIVTKSSENSEKKLNPLPLGKVLQDRLIPGCDLYYQIEIEDLSSILTVELTCNESANDLVMSLACGYFPSPLKCDARAAKSLSAEKHTIVFRPSDKNLSSELQSPIIIGIHLNIESSHHSLAFSIWALRSISPHISNEIHRVNSIIHSFNMLSENSTDELWKNMPKLHRLAQSESCSILDQKHISTHSIDTSPATKEDLPDPDLVSLEHFVSKSGRMKMRSDLVDFQSRSQSKSNRLDKLMSPNNHSDLFVPPNLEPRSMLSDRSSHTSKKNQLNKNLKLENDLKYAFNPEKYIKKTDESLPHLTQTPPNEAKRESFNFDDGRQKTEFPLLVQYSEVKPKFHQLRKFPDPKPIKYTLRK